MRYSSVFIVMSIHLYFLVKSQQSEEEKKRRRLSTLIIQIYLSWGEVHLFPTERIDLSFCKLKDLLNGTDFKRNVLYLKHLIFLNYVVWIFYQELTPSLTTIRWTNKLNYMTDVPQHFPTKILQTTPVSIVHQSVRRRTACWIDNLKRNIRFDGEFLEGGTR